MTRRELDPSAPGFALDVVRRENLRQVSRFLVIGGCSAATDMAWYFFLGWLGIGPTNAKALAYLAGVVIGFFGNKIWTFSSQRRSLAEPLVYLALYCMTLTINIGINNVALWLSENTLVAFLLATAATTVLNFLGMRLVTFRAGILERRLTLQSQVSAFRSAA